MTTNNLLFLYDYDYEWAVNFANHYLHLSDENIISIKNSYYQANVRVHFLSSGDVPTPVSNQNLHHRLEHASLVILITHDLDSINKLKSLFSTISTTLNESVTCVCLIEDPLLDETSTYQLVSWGITHHIEVVTQFLCSEDDQSLSQRLNQIIDCVQWESISKIDSTHTNTNSIQQEITDNSLQQPTRIRRGLNTKDLSRLTDELLTLEDSDEERIS